ncbi:MAG: glycosyltransferase family A protein [Flavobacteriales bacterium]|jgi:glycosyltransferase involved in cell wall biosynthesis|nr:glycosyltransferase family A protein [Flavobacteriales bacterium]
MRVSVVIPCYNVADLVGRSVASAMAQTHADLEVIAVDDGSTDGTLAMLRTLEQRYPGRLTVVARTNAGACAARNAGLERGTGTYIEFLDADDALMPEKIAHQVRLTEANDRPELIIGSGRVHTLGGRTTDEVQRTGRRDPWFELMRHGLGRTSQHLWKRSAVVAAGGWQVGLRSSQEYDLMFRMMQGGARLVYDDAVLTDVYQRPDSISRTDLAGNWVRNTELRARILAHLAALNDGRDLRPYQQVVFDCIRVLHPYSPAEAHRLHEQLIPADFKPMPSPTSSKGYILAHRLLGFRRAERLRALMQGRWS